MPRELELFIEELKPLGQKWGWKEMRRFDPSWVAQVHCPLPQIQMSIKTPMEEMIDPKITTRLVKSKQNYFYILKTSKCQNQQAQVNINKIQ